MKADARKTSTRCSQESRSLADDIPMIPATSASSAASAEVRLMMMKMTFWLLLCAREGFCADDRGMEWIIIIKSQGKSYNLKVNRWLYILHLLNPTVASESGPRDLQIAYHVFSHAIKPVLRSCSFPIFPISRQSQCSVPSLFLPWLLIVVLLVSTWVPSYSLILGVLVSFFSSATAIPLCSHRMSRYFIRNRSIWFSGSVYLKKHRGSTYLWWYFIHLSIHPSLFLFLVWPKSQIKWPFIYAKSQMAQEWHFEFNIARCATN